MPTFVDHIVMVVADLAASRNRLAARWDLTVVGEGEHASIGTANVLLSFGSAYLELLTVVDPDSPHPVAVKARADAADGDMLVGLALRVDDIAVEAERLGTQVFPLQRSGALPGSWLLTGVERAMAGPWPVFIQWEHGRPESSGTDPLGHVELRGDLDALEAWVGDDVPGLTLLQGDPLQRVLMPNGDILA